MLASELPEMRVFPSWVMSNVFTAPEWPSSTRDSPVSRLQRRMVLSLLPLATVLPSGKNATQLIAPWCPSRYTELEADSHERNQEPDPRREDVLAERGNVAEAVGDVAEKRRGWHFHPRRAGRLR